MALIEIPYTRFKPHGKYYDHGMLEIEIADYLLDSANQDKLFYELHYHILPDAVKEIASGFHVVITDDLHNDDIIGWPYMHVSDSVFFSD